MALSQSQRDVIAAIDGPPQQQAAPQMPPPPQQAMPQMPQQQRPQQTAEGQAQSKGAPQTEGDQMNAQPFIEIDFGDGRKRQLTPEAVKGMMSRYSDLNFKHAQLKPVTEVIENYLRSNPNMSPAQLAQHLTQLAAGQQPNVQFGRDGGINSQQAGQQQQPQGNQRQAVTDDDFSKWENDNASALPPGYRDMHGNMAAMMQMMQQQQALLQRVLAGASGQVDAARMAHQGAQQQRGSAVQQQIANNVDRAQMAMRLPTEAANDFMIFAHERGYTMEDFIDPQLTMTVMQDFANNRMSPEMERLRAIHQRRQAFTTATGGAPAGPAAPLNPQEADFQEFAGRVVEKKRL